jgi:hypothetical protein
MPIVVWGRKVVRSSLGVVADYCIFCHAPRAFELSAISAKAHVMLVGIGGGTLIGHSVKCSECGSPMFVEPRYKSTMARTNTANLDTLIRETNPELSISAEAERARVRRIRSNEATPEEKQLALERPLRMLNPDVETLRALRLDKEIGLGCLGTLGLVVLSSAILSALGMAGDRLAAILLVVGTVLTSRYLRRTVYPRLQRALGPFRPTEAELDVALKRLSAMGFYIGGKLNAKALLRAIRGD